MYDEADISDLGSHIETNNSDLKTDDLSQISGKG